MANVGRVPSESHPPGLILWTGWDVRGGVDADTAAAGFARAAASDADQEERYELLAVAARGFRPPRFVTVADLGGSPDDDRDRVETGERPDTEGLRPTWSLWYRRVAETRARVATPFAIYLLGVNPPADATDQELDQFNEFYTSVHLPEVAERRHALRAERYELVREVRAPHRGAPRYLAVYEVDQQGASHRRHTGPPYAKGPEVWQRHTTPWRLWYRRLGVGEPTGG